MADVKYWDDQKRPIATTDAELLIYFKSIGGTVAAANVPFLLSCPLNSLFRIASSGVMPKYIYKGGLAPANKVYLQILPANTLNLPQLCNGVDQSNIVYPPIIGDKWSETLVVYVPIIGSKQSSSGTGIQINIVGFDNSGSGGGIWVVNTASTNGNQLGDIVTLNISVKNTTYNSTGAKDNFVNVPIAEITATPGGHPLVPITITSTDNSSLPAGSSIIIAVSGHITYTGQPSTEDITGSTIEFFMVQFNING